MLLAKIVCSDPGCESERELAVTHLHELEGFACDRCGHGFVLAAVSELRPAGGEVISIAGSRDRSPHRRAA